MNLERVKDCIYPLVKNNMTISENAFDEDLSLSDLGLLYSDIINLQVECDEAIEVCLTNNEAELEPEMTPAVIAELYLEIDRKQDRHDVGQITCCKAKPTRE